MNKLVLHRNTTYYTEFLPVIEKDISNGGLYAFLNGRIIAMNILINMRINI